MKTWLDEQVAQIRRQRRPADEGSLWLLLFDGRDAEPGAVAVISGAMADLNDRMTHNVALIIERVPAPLVLLAVPRRDGHPCVRDRQLWSALRELLRDGATELVNLVVVGDCTYWRASSLVCGCAHQPGSWQT